MSEYQEMFVKIDPWLHLVIESVKKDLKQEHLKKDKEFCKRNFLGKGAQQVSAEEMVPAYRKEISEGNIGLAEFIASRWLLKNTDVYGFFEKKLSEINPDFDQIEALDESFSQKCLKEALAQFDPLRVYLFCILNAVVFPEEMMSDLRDQAEKSFESQEKQRAEKEESETMEAQRKRFEREIQALANRFEKKLGGLERKYIRDTENLKEQVRMLSRKLEQARKIEAS